MVEYEDWYTPRRKIFATEEDIEENVKDQENMPKGYVTIDPDSNLAHDLEHESFFVLMYEMTCCPKPNEGPRFLATMGVFTCIALFARSESGRAFAVHIPIGACHCVLKEKKHPFLEEVTVALKWVFRKEDVDKVKVTLAGGQEAQDNDVALGCRFSKLVKECVKRAGIHNIDDRLLNIFPGVPFSLRFEENQARDNQSFQLIALDRETGQVVVQTRSEEYGKYSVSALGRRNKMETERYIQSVSMLTLEGQRCRNVKW